MRLLAIANNPKSIRKLFNLRSNLGWTVNVEKISIIDKIPPILERVFTIFLFVKVFGNVLYLIRRENSSLFTVLGKEKFFSKRNFILPSKSWRERAFSY